MKNVFQLPIHVRFRDIDAMGHVNNAVYFTYFEEGRLALFESFSSGSGPAVFPFILARIGCDFLRPVTLNTELSLEIWVTEIGIKSFTLAYSLGDMADASVVYARGDSVQVCFDYAQNKSIAISDALKQNLAQYQ